LRTTRRTFLGMAALPLVGRAARPDSSGIEFPERRPAGGLFPTPAAGSEVGINPPGFAWWRAPRAASYRLLVRTAAGRPIYESEDLPYPAEVPREPLDAGKYLWNVEARNASGETVARRGWWPFTVPEGIPELAWEDPKAILARVPEAHPRYIFLKEDLANVRRSLEGGRKLAWQAVIAAADRALKTPLPEPPRYHTFEGRDRQRMGYTVYFREFRRRVDGTLSALAVAYLLSGKERYGVAAKKLLLEIESWGAEGPMSVLSRFGDEPGLSMARHGHRAYDWLYDLFDETERKRARQMTIARARQVFERLQKADYLASPAESHNGRLIAYLAEYAIVLKGEATEAPEWLDYSLRALMTFYPHWGDADGGWAEGVSYALSYNTLYLPAIESLRVAAGVDLYQRPFFRNARRFFLYCSTPRGEMQPFGDGAERSGVGAQGAALMQHHGRRFGDAAAVWWAKETHEKAGGGDPLIAMLTEDTVAPAPPAELPAAAVFHGIGWAALHSALDRPQEDTFVLFKSSPFGSVSHSHADQNSFCILKGGKALAIPSGYYGPAYGMPHHANWTRQTKANNSILVNGDGQPARDPEAAGRISDFRHLETLTYVCGDASVAYGGKLTRFVRHVMFLRPGIIAMLDEIEAPEPAEFSWLLHSLEKIQVDAVDRTVVCARDKASLTVRLDSDAGLLFRQTSAFATAYNEGNPPEYRQEVPDQWHFTARTERRTAKTRIAALMVVRGEDEGFAVEWQYHPGWMGVALAMETGAGQAWVQTSPRIPGPGSLRSADAVVAGFWQSMLGEEEEVLVIPAAGESAPSGRGSD
jgi:hypothetical protein